MLAAIEVKDFASIEHARLAVPATGFCVLTGETGVGKSLLIDALAAALGLKLRRRLVRKGSGQAEIALAFDLQGRVSALNLLKRHGLAAPDGELVARRVIDAQGRSRAYLNGSLVPVGTLAEVVGSLVGICGQNEHIRLKQAVRRRELLDMAAKALPDAAQVATCHQAHLDAIRKLEQAEAAAERDAERLAALDAELLELDELDFTLEAWEERNLLLTQHENAAEIGQLRAGLGAQLDELSGQLAGVQAEAKRLAELLPAAAKANEDIAALAAVADDAARELSKLEGDAVESDRGAIEEAEAFVAEALRLARKYRLPAPQDLPALRAERAAERAQLGGADVAGLRAAAQEAEEQWRQAAEQLSAKRKQAAPRLARQVQASLRQLGMPAARFAIELQQLSAPAKQGLEEVAFGFAARRQGKLGEPGEVASGGELSRLTLALFSHAGGDGGRDMVFDEVDAGISGKTAAHVGSLLGRLGSDRLVLCVSHLPQVAAAATTHWLVRADADEGTASFEQIEGAAREEEIARMLAGKRITATSRSNAREILATAAG